MKIKNLNQLNEALDDEIGWRIQEISFLKRSSANNGENSPRALIRASIPIAYAHWEGFVKNSSIHYLDFVASQVSTGEVLRSCFLGLTLKSKLDAVSKSTRAFRLWHEAVELMESAKREKPNLRLKPRIENIGNLDFQAFREISYACGIDFIKYETKQKFIDEVLVAKRNYIAHGDRIFPTSQEIEGISDTCIALLREYKNDILNGASQRLYLNQ